MMNFMSDFFNNYQISQTEMARSSTLTMYPPQQLQSQANLLNRSMQSLQQHPTSSGYKLQRQNYLSST